MSDIEQLRATVERLAGQVRALEDQVEIMQLVAQYGPSVDSGRGEVTASLWTEDGSFDAVPVWEMRGRDDIISMVHGPGHQRLIHDGCGHGWVGTDGSAVGTRVPTAAADRDGLNAATPTGDPRRAAGAADLAIVF